MPLPSPSPDAPAVVTGASTGIGEQLARQLAARGHSLVLVARRRERLEALAEALEDAHGVAVELRACDLTDRDARKTLREELASREVGILCNNAGCGTFGRLAELDPNRERAQLELNAMAVQDLTLAVLPGMVARGRGALLFVGSLAGHQPLPCNATYSASKAFVNAFAEALHEELAGTGVSCTLLAPGPVRTDFMEAARISEINDRLPALAWVSAERTAREALDGLDRGRRVVTPGVVARLAAAGGRHGPRSMLLPVIKGVMTRLT